MDQAHDFSCVRCHGGNNRTEDKQNAHSNLVPHPAAPDNWKQYCGECHQKNIDALERSTHFTLANATNMFRMAFGAKKTLASYVDTPAPIKIEDKLDLADDLLRRRCFRCHLRFAGDNYSKTTRGLGCAACHMRFSDKSLSSHKFSRPTDAQCLACHYGNYVGADYYGRFEHDFNTEYRTPYTTNRDNFRPYGVEFHELQPDIHMQKGMGCVDCHTSRDIMGNTPSLSCADCHDIDKLQKRRPHNISFNANNSVFLLHGATGITHTIPLMTNPAHQLMPGKLTCQVCHAQWTYNDIDKHYLRSDTDNYDLFEKLFAQGSSEVERIILTNNDYDLDEIPAQMSDKLTGQLKTGIWHKSYTMRRWETVTLGKTSDGIITTIRPFLDYQLSWINDEDEVLFDSIQAEKKLHYQPYTPHTTGLAGLFYLERIHSFLERQNQPEQNSDSSIIR